MQDWIAFPAKVVPRWFGQDLSLPPGTEMRPGATEWADDPKAGRGSSDNLETGSTETAVWESDSY